MGLGSTARGFSVPFQFCQSNVTICGLIELYCTGLNGSISRGQRMLLLALNKAQAEKIKSFKDAEKRSRASKRKLKEYEDADFSCSARSSYSMMTPRTKVKRWLFRNQSPSRNIS